MRVVTKRRGLDAQQTLAAILRIASLVYGRKFSVCFVKGDAFGENFRVRIAI